MNGIEKISARILADAETEAAAIRAQAEEKAAQIRQTMTAGSRANSSV